MHCEFSFAYGPICSQDAESLKKAPESALPVICFRDGSPPPPDVSNIFLNDSGNSGESDLVEI